MDDLSVCVYIHTCVRRSVQCIVEKRRIGSEAVWHRRSDGSRDEAGSGVWGSVHGKGYFWGRIWGAPLSTGTYRTYVCYSAATLPSCQITLGRLVIIIIISERPVATFTVGVVTFSVHRGCTVAGRVRHLCGLRRPDHQNVTLLGLLDLSNSFGCVDLTNSRIIIIIIIFIIIIFLFYFW